VTATLDPDAERVLELIRQSGRPPYQNMTPQEAREVYRKGRAVLQPDPPEVAAMRMLQTPDGVQLRLYRGLETEQRALLPALIYFHGGGWVFGDLDSHDGICRLIANAAGIAVVSVDYRLAPEHKFPAAVEDSIAATEWVAANAAALGLDANRLAVGGDSAGGNLAAVVALAVRDRGGPALRFQLLLYPAVDLTFALDSHRRITDGLPLTHATMCWFRDLYLHNESEQRDWRASPLHAADLGGLPPAYVLTVGFDPLASEGEAFVNALAKAGVAAEHHHLERQMHGFLTMGRLIAAADGATRAAAAALRSALHS
jgi:acetyl esterase